jgi:hypothetical protein
MKQLLKKIMLFGIVFIVINTIIFMCLQRKSFGLVTENQRVSFMENSVNSPKMIVSGGSNVGYSIDSELLTTTLGMEVFNVSFFISHDYEFVLNFIATNLKKGDIFIYIPEYDNYYITNENIMSDALCASIYNKPSFFNHLSLTQKVNFLTKVPKMNVLFMYKNMKYISANTTSVSETNDRGDNISHLNKQKTWEAITTTRYEKYNYDSKLSNLFKKALISAKKIAESKGAFFYIGYPSIAKSQYDKRFADDLKEFYKNSDLKLIGKPEIYIFSDDLIHDHPYHTTKIGRTMRTELLIKDIKKASILK